MQNISLFIEEERKYYDGKGNNLFAFALGVIQRKYEKIWMLREFAKPLIIEYGKLVSESCNSNEQSIDMSSASLLTKQVELFFESFFMYGAILCDDVAQLFIHMFGQVRNVKLGTHRKLSANFPKYAEELSLIYNDKFIELANYIESELCDYRDKQIVHDFHIRKIDAVGYDFSQQDVRITYGLLYPKNTDVYISSKSWGELLEALDKYIGMVLDIVRDNRDKIQFENNAKMA